MRPVEFLLVICFSCAAIRIQMEGKDSLSHVPPPDWHLVGRAKSSATIELVVALKQKNLDLLQEKLLDVADPASAHYGKHESFEEVNRLVAPSQITVSTVLSWLRHVAGVSPEHRVSTDHGFLQLTLPIEVAEKLVGVKVRAEYSKVI
jgi:tripeptidyl-peptidase-1